ncbi:hypothetical protein HIMB114_00000310 [alpha proteobacterium HIMB114]|nr:hypothetical protein HIMB114_00000310 [alpha proteobacterium HIMB114]
MISIKKKSNIFLIFFIFLSIFFYGYFINQNKGSIKLNNEEKNRDLSLSSIESGISKFKNVEYKVNINGKDYITKALEAIIIKDKSDLIQLNKVHSFTKLKDYTLLNIYSDKADYFETDKNIRYFNNVTIINKDKTITANMASFFPKKNLIRIEGNIKMNDQQNTIYGDVAELNTNTNNLKIFMLQENSKVYGRSKKK